MPSACFIFGAGPFFGLPVSPAPGDFVIAADGGYRHCLAANLTPDLLLGDFDSLTLAPWETPPAKLPRQVFPIEKDDTDTMLAIKEGLTRGFRCFHLYGGTGGRMDHTLANLQALGYIAQAGGRGYLYDEHFVFTAIAQGDSLTLPAREKGIFSVFCLGQGAEGVTIRGGQYSLESGALSPFLPLGVSNHFQGRPVEVQVKQGCLLIGYEFQ